MIFQDLTPIVTIVDDPNCWPQLLTLIHVHLVVVT